MIVVAILTAVVIAQCVIINMKRVSTKRAVQEKEYAKIKKEKKDYMVDKGYYRCIFCNSKLDPDDDDHVGWHHLTGRDGELISEWANIVPGHNLCHSNFHHFSVDGLMKNKWYVHFLDRLKNSADNNEYFRQAYNNELRRLQKAGVYDNEMFLKMYINENDQ